MDRKFQTKTKNAYRPTRDFLGVLDDECKYKMCIGSDDTTTNCNHCELVKISKEKLGYDYLRII